MHRLITALVLLAGILPARDGVAVTWSLSYTPGVDAALEAGLQRFAASVKEHSGGGLVLRPQPGTDPAHTAAEVQAGRLPAAVIPLSELAREDALIALDQVPFLATSFGDARKLWQVVRPEVERKLASRGLLLLYALPETPRALLSRGPIRSIGDFTGLRVVMDAPALVDFVKLSGARAAKPGARGELLKDARADLAFVSASDAVADEAWRYGRFYILAPAWLPKQLVVANLDALRTLDRAARDGLLSAADGAREPAWRSAEALTAERVQNLRDRGVKVREPEVGFLIRLEELGRALLFAWSDAAGDAGAALVEAYYDIK